MKDKTEEAGFIRCRRRAGGWLAVEAMISVTVLGILIAGFPVAQSRLARFNRIQWLRRRCVLAGQAQLDSIAATGKPIPSAEVERLWPGLTSQVMQTPGTGDWEGLTRVAVVTRGSVAGRTVKVELARYVEGAQP